MNFGILRGIATAGIMAAVLIIGPAAIVVPEVPVQATEPPSVSVQAVAVPPAPPEPAAPIVAQDAALPWITAESVAPSALEDSGEPYSGFRAAPKTDGLTVHATPGGPAFGLLPARVIDSDGSDRIWMPVIGSTTGPWLQVLLPARRNLPSSGAPVNGATGWVLASEVLTKTSAVTVEVDLSAGTITVAESGNAQAVFPVTLSGGDQTSLGRSFVMGRYMTSLSQLCSAQPMLILSAQSEGMDGYFGQETAVQAIHAFSTDCQNLSGYTQATPGCVIADEADIPRLLALVPDGTPVTVRG